MKQELEEKLFQQFPWLEARNVWSGEKLGCCIGMDCEDGWHQLIYDLCKGIDKVLKNCTPEFLKGFYVQQVKEKYATLRFYTSYVNKEIYDLIAETENKSSEICEICGDTGKICVRNLWYKTLCDKCMNKHSYISCKNKEEI